MIPTPEAAMMLDRRYARPHFNLRVDLTDPSSIAAHRLEQNILEDFNPKACDRVRILLISLDKIAASPLVGNACSRVLGKPRDPAILRIYVKDLAKWTAHALSSVTGDERIMLDRILESRGVHLSPVGRDALGRPTHYMQTPFGRIALDYP